MIKKIILLKPRDSSSLKFKYEGVKKLLRGNKSDIFKTGGGPHDNQYISVSETEKELYETIQISIEGLLNRFGCDTYTCDSNFFKDDNVEIIKQPNKSPDNTFDYESLMICEGNYLFIFTYILVFISCFELCVFTLILFFIIDIRVDEPFHNKNEKEDITISSHQPCTFSQSNTESWTPLNSTKQLKSTAKHAKLTCNNT